MTKKSILIVEDQLALAQTLRRALSLPQLGGYQVKSCGSGEAALELLNEFSFDLVISDLELPGMNGFELLEHLRQTHPETGRVLITAFGSLWVEEQAHRLADAYLLKPFEMPDLIEAIQHIFDNRENNNEH